MDIEARLAAVEARQRAYGMHDPECPALLTQQAQQHTGAYLVPGECDCWLQGEG